MIIYKTTNLINGKVYIGKDSKDNPSYKGSGTLITRAIKKYGIENFTKETLETCDSVEQLNIREQFWIDTLNSLSPTGYNIARGGAGGDTRHAFTDEQYLEWLAKKSKAQSGKTSYWKGKARAHHSQKIREAHSNGAYGNYEWVRRPRTPKNVKKLGFPEGKTRTRYECDVCGRMISKNMMLRHKNGRKCIGRG